MEAQYGDFSNMSQMMFDTSARAKWGERSGLTLSYHMLLKDRDQSIHRHA